MKKILLLFSLILAFLTNAQVNSYSFAQSSGTYTPLTGPTVLATATANTVAGSLDNTIYPVTLPFNISFNGTNYSAINVSTNGFITFGATAPGGATYSPISSTETYSGAVSAFGADLNTVFSIGGVTGNISWGIEGTAPNREIVIQWADFRPAYTTSTTNVYTFSFQIRLRETSNTVSIVYKNGSYLAGTTSISGTRQIGLRGTTNTDFNNRTNSTSVLFTNSTAGTANTSTQAYNTTAATPGMPTDGLTYTWTPPSCFSPSNLVSSATSPTSGVIGWTAPTTVPGNGYEYVVSTTNTPPAAGASGTPTSATSVPQPGLTTGVTYYWWVRSICSPTDKSNWVAGPSFIPGQIGSGTTTMGNLPISSCFGFSYSQQIYTATEVGGAVGNNNLITKIKFYVGTTASPLTNYNQWVVYMGNTTQNNFATTTSWVPLSGMQQVYSGTIPTLTNGTWVELTLNTPFVWNGTSNIVIAVDENASGWACTQQWGDYPAGTNRGMVHYSDSENANPASPPTASQRFATIPRVQFVAEALQPCTTNPPANLTVGQLTPTSATVSWIPSSGATYVVRYRLLPSGPWISTTLTTPLSSNYTMTGLTELSNYEVQVATICGGTQGAFSPSLPFTTPAVTYCSAGATSADEYISNVTVTPIGLAPMVSNSTMATAAPYYADYTADPNRLVTLIRNPAFTNSISVKRDWPGTVFACSTIVWIDWNRNGTFETSEEVMNVASNSNSINTGTFVVPAGAYTGNLNLRMRVAIKEGTPPGPCGTYSWGEVEDYSVKLIDLQPCTTAAPTPVSVTNLTATTAYVSWLPAANATYRIRWRQGTTGAWQPTGGATPGYVQLGANTSWYTITGLTEQTAYEVQVMTVCNGTPGSWGPSVPFTTPPLTYCPMVGTGTNDYISNVKVTPVNFPVMDNNSLQTNYISYTTPATLINLEIGSTGNQLSVSKAWTTSTFADAVYVWIDWNRDGIFSDTTERILASASSTTTPVTTTFNVPSTGVYTGNLTTTMRVVLKRGSAPVMCVDPINGEVEDYAVKLRPCSTVTPGLPTFSAITHVSATVNWTPATNNQTYIVQYRPVTNPASAWTTITASAIGGNPPLQLTGLTPATQYEVQISALCGTTPGVPTAIRTFTTRCDPTPPNVTVTNVTANSALVTWNPLVPSATYVLRWREVGTLTWTTVSAPTLPQPPANSYTISGLSSFKTYEVQVANICNGETTTNPWSNPQVFTTVRICEVPPPGLTITQLNPTTAEVVWDAFTGAGATNTYILRYRKVGIPSWTTVTVNTNTYTITGLLELTKYEMQVANVCTGTPGNFTPPYYFTTPTVTYCQMQSTNSASEYISKVTAKPTNKPQMINVSTGTTYSDFTGNPLTYIEMIQGSTGNQITVDKNLGSGSAAGVAVWIDFNRNGEFDLNERILADGPNTSTTASATFTVPADAFVSMTDYKYVVMRVAMSKDAIPVNCTSFDNGEVEDYLVRISKLPVVNPLNQTDVLIYPNPTSNILLVRNTKQGRGDALYYNIYNAAGQLVMQGLPKRVVKNANGEIEIMVKTLINGVYTIEIHDGDNTVMKKFIKE